MLNWLFKKKLRHLTQEQQLDKEVEDVVRAMKDSLGEAGRWEVKVRHVEEVWRAVHAYSGRELVEGVDCQLVHMLDTVTDWSMTVKLREVSIYTERNTLLLEKVETKERNIPLCAIGRNLIVVGVDVKNHEEYAYMPSQEQLASIYRTWWGMCILPEIERQRVERERKEMQTKREGLGKLKALYGKG